MRFAIDDGRIVVRTGAREHAVMHGLLHEFTVLAASRREDPMRGEKAPKDPALARLLPDPVHGDAEAAAELRFLTEASLISHKLANAETVRASLADGEPTRLDAAQELAWLKTLTDLRLVLAARLGIDHDGDEGAGATESDRWMRAAYHWLGATQAELLEAIEVRDARRDGEPEHGRDPAGEPAR